MATGDLTVRIRPRGILQLTAGAARLARFLPRPLAYALVRICYDRLRIEYRVGRGAWRGVEKPTVWVS